jgi:hypothetical protein
MRSQAAEVKALGIGLPGRFAPAMVRMVPE